MEYVKKLTKENFDEFIKSGNAFVDFYADWCGPCKMMSPVLDELSKEYGGKVTFGKLNVDEEKEISDKYDIQSIPNMKLFGSGKVLGEFVGARTKDRLKKEIDSLL